MMNYHWYLKQELVFPYQDSVEMMFDVEHPTVLHVLSSDGEKGEYRRYEFVWDIYTATTLSTQYHGSVAVVDGGE
jgi:hypothetical protein